MSAVARKIIEAVASDLDHLPILQHRRFAELSEGLREEVFAAWEKSVDRALAEASGASETVRLMNAALGAQVTCLEGQEVLAAELVRKLNFLAASAEDGARALLEAGAEAARAERDVLRARIAVAKVALR